MAKIRREYAGGAVSTTTATLLAATNASSVSITLNATTGWPFGSNKFFVVFDPGTANEEKVLASRASSGDSSITIASDSDRAQDGTSAVSHAAGATVYPVFTAQDADEANELASMWEAKGDLVSLGSADFARLAVGSDNYVLQADSGAGAGLAWGLVDTDNLAADAVTAAKIAAGAVDSAELASGAVTVEKMASDSASRLVPAGTVAATVRSSADTGWLLLNGATVANANTSYPALWAVAPTSWKSGTSLVLPNMQQKMLFGQGGSGGTTLGATGGANTATIGTTHLPKHTHTLSAHTHTMKNHTHTLGNHTHTLGNHTHDVDPISATSGGPSKDVVHRYGAGYIASTGAGTSFRIPDMNSDPLTPSTGMQVYTSDFSHTHSTNVGNTTSGAPSNNTSDGPSNNTSDGPSDNTSDGPNSDTTGDGGFTNTALPITNAHLAVNFQIKAH